MYLMPESVFYEDKILQDKKWHNIPPFKKHFKIYFWEL